MTPDADALVRSRTNPSESADALSIARPDGRPWRMACRVLNRFARLARAPSVVALLAADMPCLRLADRRSEVRIAVTCHLFALCFDANDPLRLAHFWADVLGWEIATPHEGIALVPSDDTGFRIRFLPTEEQKVAENQMHFDLTSTSLEDQRQTVARSLRLGGRHIDVGQRPEEAHVVLGDPEGNEFCVIEPGNSFLADCGFVGALACDGTQAVTSGARHSGGRWSGTRTRRRRSAHRTAVRRSRGAGRR